MPEGTGGMNERTPDTNTTVIMPPVINTPGTKSATVTPRGHAHQRDTQDTNVYWQATSSTRKTSQSEE